MSDEPEDRRSGRAERATRHRELQRRRREQESAKAQVLIDGFVDQARRAGIPPEELTVRPWTGGRRYRTGISGWYLRTDRSVGVDVDGRYYELVVPPMRFGRWRTARLEPTPPPLQVGEGARDGESIALADLVAIRLQRR
jgi:hypothetical protein